MYASFFGLKEKPFNLTPDPRYLYLSPSHEEALAHLVYGIQEKQGLIVLTGEAGTGKTTLLHTLFEYDVKIAFVFYPKLRLQDLLHYILNEFGCQTSAPSTAECLMQLKAFLIDQHNKGETMVLVIDEAQDLSLGLLDDIRMLNNLETPEAKLLQIVLVGRSELQDKLHVHLRQRLGSTSNIHPLSAAETKAYIQHRVTVAGGDAQALLTRQALKAIHACTSGVPQRINTVCDKALLTAYAAGQSRISARLVRQGIRDLEPRPRHGRWAMRLQKIAAVLAGLLMLSTVSATYPPVQTSLQQAYEFVKLQIENSISHMFEPSATLADGPDRSKS